MRPEITDSKELADMSSRYSFFFRTVLLTVLGGLAAFAPAWAQNELPGAFAEVVDVRVINLDVVVTDRDGVRVSGLGPEDFELRVDGETVPIEYFTEVLGGVALAEEDRGATGTLPALAPGEPAGTSYLVFVDDYFARITDRNRVIDGLIDQLPMLNPRDRMAIVAFDGREIEMLTTWSQNVETLERVLKRARDRPARGLQREAELRNFEATRALVDFDPFAFSRPLSSTLDTQLTIDERQQVDVLSDQLRRVVLAAAASLRSFGRPPGRKVMLLLSGGWPYNPVQWVVNDPTRPVFEFGVDVASELYHPLVEAANRLSYTIYPADVPGFDSRLVSAEQALPTDLSGPGRLQSVDREQEEQATLAILARETGGKAWLNAAATEAFGRTVEDTRSYYWIGFTPNWEGDDANHRVEVEVKRPGLRLRSRESFSDLSRSREVSMMVESALLFGDAPASQPLDVEVGRAKRAGWGKVEMPLTVWVPAKALTFLPKEGGYVAQAELRVAVIDEEGNTSEVPVIPLILETAELPDEDEKIRYRTSMKLRKRKHDLVVSIYDQPSGAILTEKLEISPK